MKGKGRMTIERMFMGGTTLAIVIALCFIEICPLSAREEAKTQSGIALYVDPVNGNDKNTGDSSGEALKTIQRARDVVRGKKLNVNMTEDLTVYLRGGRYELTDTLVFDSRDSGSNGFQIVYRNYKDEQPVICGGKQVSEWKPVPGKPYYIADVPESSWKDVTFNNVMKQDFSSDGYAAYFRRTPKPLLNPPV
jgi:hypothetical protein